MARRTLIQGGNVLTVDPAIPDLACGDVLIDDGLIVAVGPSVACADAEVVDAAGMVVCPGFVDTHRHTWQTLLRGICSDHTLSDYLACIRMGYGGFYEPADAYLGNYAGALEALNAGVTTIVDHSHVVNSPEHADALVDGLVQSGIRAVFCYGLFVSPKHDPFRFEDDGPEWRRADARRIRDRLSGDDGLVAFGLAPAEVEQFKFEVAAEEIRFGREIGAKVISCHAAMGAYSAFAKPPFAVNLGRKQMLGPDILLVHGNALSRYELGMIRDHGAAISSAPEVEVQMGMGRPIIGAALRAGAMIGLGVDVVSNIGGDMFHPMRSALVEERGFLNDALARNDQVPRRLEFTCKDVVRLATQGGAECIGLGSRIGSLTPGKQADVVCVRRDALHTMAAREPNSALVHYATPADVDSVWVGGKAVKRRGGLVDVDVSSVVARVWAAREGLEQKMADVSIRALQAVVGFRNYGN